MTNDELDRQRAVVHHSMTQLMNLCEGLIRSRCVSDLLNKSATRILMRMVYSKARQQIDRRKYAK